MKQGESLATIHYNQPLTNEFMTMFYDAYQFANEPCEKLKLIEEILE